MTQSNRIHKAGHECYHHPKDDLDSIILLPNYSYFNLCETVSANSAESLERAMNYVQDTVDQATKLGSLKSGVIIGNESTYQLSDTQEDQR